MQQALGQIARWIGQESVSPQRDTPGLPPVCLRVTIDLVHSRATASDVPRRCVSAKHARTTTSLLGYRIVVCTAWRASKPGHMRLPGPSPTVGDPVCLSCGSDDKEGSHVEVTMRPKRGHAAEQAWRAQSVFEIKAVGNKMGDVWRWRRPAPFFHTTNGCGPQASLN